MAKTKTKEKVVDLTPKPEKITDEQLKKLQTTVSNINRSHMDLGSIESRKHSILHYVAGIQDEMTLLQAEFNKDYGTNDINIETGVITYTKENGEADKKD